MTKIFLFDVDGTLTPAREHMQDDFAAFFREFVASENVYLVSGSDYPKIQEQVPQDILDLCVGVFGCSGAEYHEKDQIIYQRTHEFPDHLLSVISDFVTQSPYEFRYGNHVELRPGMLNISIVGRDATQEQRKHYHHWDEEHHERSRFAANFNQIFDGYEATCGGEISIDIVPAGWNKSVVKREILDRTPGAELIFFGDKMGPQGNDRPLALALDTPCGKHRAVEVMDYRETWKHLAQFINTAGG